MAYHALKVIELPFDVDKAGNAIKRKPGELIPKEVMAKQPDSAIRRFLLAKQVECDFKDGEKRLHEMDIVDHAGGSTIVDERRIFRTLRNAGVDMSDLNPGEHVDRVMASIAYDVIVMGRTENAVLTKYLGEDPPEKLEKHLKDTSPKAFLKRLQSFLAKAKAAAKSNANNDGPRAA